MTLKNRISLLVSISFAVLYGLASVFVYVLASNFRKEEFNDRLEIKALKTIKFLSDHKIPDYNLLRLMDKNSLNKLYNEKTLIFDSNFKLIYSSIDGAKINWYLTDLKYLKKNKSFFKKQGENEFYGIFFDTNDKDYYVLISAKDRYGNRKTVYLKYILLISYLVFTSICWFLTSWMVRKAIMPLGLFHQKIKNINENNLDTRIVSKSNKNEIDLIANEFNFMMDRIEESYQKQKEFTAHASHELRTPLSRITSQIENKINDPNINNESKSFLKTILSDVNQLTELIHSLLLLSKTDNRKTHEKELIRIDELLFNAIEKINKSYPDFIILFDMEDNEQLETALEIQGNKNILEIALTNVLKNACVYSTNKQAEVTISCDTANLYVSIANNGKTLDSEKQLNLFQPFMRGKNATGTIGFGLGLRIVQRILNIHNATIHYSIPKENTNLFQIKFPFQTKS
ncbi:HAMP domain-containing sensor histidine kinase [Flavobacterium sp. NG2]|uniref:HAMP domain-containing sensor histidine kinase n=1 Tax=Flavobacterium sp. NG2 TaxID=3097547 RepID=UPI002A7F02F5|nr:HAMP domain-containing sensor histidine kinase [Flavobacterium sp. NG2]WPR70508.1 HAMP domain-containing sensor histidine kinase [Flavobacterium sp. NG2]